MKSTTKVKLNRLAEAIVNRYTSDVMDTSNFLYLAKKLAEVRDIKIHYNTIRDNQPYLRSRINLIIKNDLFHSGLEKPQVEVKPQIEVKQEVKSKEVIKTIIFYSDGSFEEVLPNKEGDTPTEPEYLSHQGLFIYRTNGTFFRLGKYKGCNVDDESSIGQYFDNWFDFYSYIVSCLRPKTLNNLKQSPEVLQKSIQKLLELKGNIESKLPEFSNTLRVIRNKKGYTDGN